MLQKLIACICVLNFMRPLAMNTYLQQFICYFCVTSLFFATTRPTELFTLAFWVKGQPTPTPMHSVNVEMTLTMWLGGKGQHQAKGFCKLVVSC